MFGANWLPRAHAHTKWDDNDLFFETNFESQNYLFLRMEYMYKKKNIVQNSKSSIAKSYSDCLVVWASPSQEEKKTHQTINGTSKQAYLCK